MEKRIFLAFFIILAFFVVWSRFGPKPITQPVVQQEVRVGSSSPAVLSPIAPVSKNSTPGEEDDSNLPQITINNFTIMYSPQGGYIRKIFAGDSENALPFENIGYSPEEQGQEFSVYLGENVIRFEKSGGVKKEFIFQGDSLTIKLTPPILKPIILFSNRLSSKALEQRYQEVFYSRDNIIKRSNAKKTKEGVYRNVDFAGARSRYYCFSLIKGTYDIEWVKDKKTTHMYLVSPPPEISIYIGPQIEKKLKPYGLEGIIYYGFFHIISTMMIKLLGFFYFLTKNWGLSLICFATLIYFLLFPFTSKSTKAMKQMQQIQPEIEALKQKYKDNPQKLQKETIALYRQYKINPLGGCLPLIFQLPVFIALYQVLFRFFELKGAEFLWITDLSLPDHLYKIPFQGALFQGALSHINLLPILIVIVGLIQQKVTASSSGSQQQKQMGLFFAVFLGVIFYNFPSALVLYWFIQNLLTLSYQIRISKPQPAHT